MVYYHIYNLVSRSEWNTTYLFNWSWPDNLRKSPWYEKLSLLCDLTFQLIVWTISPYSRISNFFLNCVKRVNSTDVVLHFSSCEKWRNVWELEPCLCWCEKFSRHLVHRFTIICSSYDIFTGGFIAFGFLALV